MYIYTYMSIYYIEMNIYICIYIYTYGCKTSIYILVQNQEGGLFTSWRGAYTSTGYVYMYIYIYILYIYIYIYIFGPSKAFFESFQ